MNILIREPDAFPQAALRRLATVGEVIIGPETMGADAAEAVFIRLSTRIDAGFHARHPKLRWIVSPTTGLNHIDTGYFAARGIEVISLRGRVDFLDTIHATAEHTIAIALAALRSIPSAAHDVLAGRWNRYPFKGRELYGKTVLIYGYGRIGRLVAPLYRAFGCDVRAIDIVTDRVPPDMRCDPDAVLSEIDILSIHLPLDDSTQGMIDGGMIDKLSRRAIIVNTSRGEILDQPALLDALEQRRIAGAALDVLWGEPNPIDAEMQARIKALSDRLLITPHIGGFTHESLEAVETHIVEAFIDAVHDR